MSLLKKTARQHLICQPDGADGCGIHARATEGFCRLGLVRELEHNAQKISLLVRSRGSATSAARKRAARCIGETWRGGLGVQVSAPLSLDNSIPRSPTAYTTSGWKMWMPYKCAAQSDGDRTSGRLSDRVESKVYPKWGAVHRAHLTIGRWEHFTCNACVAKPPVGAAIDSFDDDSVVTCYHAVSRATQSDDEDA